MRTKVTQTHTTQPMSSEKSLARGFVDRLPIVGNDIRLPAPHHQDLGEKEYTNRGALLIVSSLQLLMAFTALIYVYIV